jgi:nickel transport protein
MTPMASAHKVYIFAWVEGDTVYTDSYFSKSKKIADGKIEVFDADGKKLLEGKTDEDGAFSFKIPKKTDLRIVLEATMGHKGEFLLTADELGEVSPETVDVAADEPPKESPEVAVASSAPSPTGIETTELKRILEEALEARLKPISRGIARLEEERGPSTTDIVGGLGYIFGLMGVALYFKSRKKS